MITENFGNIDAFEFGSDMVKRLNSRWSLNLNSYINNDALSPYEAKKLMTTRLLEAILEELNQYNIESGEFSIEEEMANNQLLQNYIKNATLAADGDEGTDVEPNITITENNAKIIEQFRGKEINDYVYSLAKRFENMTNCKTPGQLAIEIVGGAMVSIFISMAVKVIKEFKKQTTKNMLKAVFSGVKAVGVGTAISVAVIILIQLIWYLIKDNPKKIMGFILNNTDETFTVKNWRDGRYGYSPNSDLYMKHGYISGFMQDSSEGDLSKPYIQLEKRIFLKEMGEEEENFIFCGIYTAQKNMGLLGCEGTMILTPSLGKYKIAHQFAVPYLENNGTNICLLDANKDIKTLNQELYKSRKVHIENTYSDKNLKLSATVSSTGGGVIGMIASIKNI